MTREEALEEVREAIHEDGHLVALREELQGDPELAALFEAAGLWDPVRDQLRGLDPSEVH